jgi:hypothetical protein
MLRLKKLEIREKNVKTVKEQIKAKTESKKTEPNPSSGVTQGLDSCRPLHL